MPTYESCKRHIFHFILFRFSSYLVKFGVSLGTMRKMVLFFASNEKYFASVTHLFASKRNDRRRPLDCFRQYTMYIPVYCTPPPTTRGGKLVPRRPAVHCHSEKKLTQADYLKYSNRYRSGAGGPVQRIQYYSLLQFTCTSLPTRGRAGQYNAYTTAVYL